MLGGTNTPSAPTPNGKEKEMIIKHSPARFTMSSTTPNTCYRCLLRAKNNRVTLAYHDIPTASPPSPSVPSPCSSCLGILQEPALRSAVQQIAKLLPTVTHASSFKINAAFPPQASLIRHRALGLAQQPHTNPISLREVVKWTLCYRLHRLGLTYSHDAQLFVNLVYEHPESHSDASLVVDPIINNPPHPRKRSRNNAPPPNSTSNIARVLDSLSDLDFRRAVPVPSPTVKTPVQVTATLSTTPLLLAGNYLKSSRIMSQTPWFVDTPQSPSRQTETQNQSDNCSRSQRTQFSVEEIVTSGIGPLLKPEKITFTAGGREDVDVRMLGSGRPFVVEVLNPRVVPSLVTPELVARMVAISDETSKAVTVQNLRVVPKSYFARMREFETEKRKHYRCVVWVAEPQNLATLRRKLEVDGGFQLDQKTPLRVLHRRTQAVRQRYIYEAQVVRIVNTNTFVLDLVAQAGTYIKEFVHGDNGRTIPNVSQLLGCDADILQLDVTRISRHGEA